MTVDTSLSGAQTEAGNHHNRHHHHHRDDRDGRDGSVLTLGSPEGQVAPGALRIVEEAIARLPEDVGAIFEEAVIEAFSTLRATDLANYVRLRQKAKQANPACSVTEIDRAIQGDLPAPGADPSVLDELVALARARCQLQHDADRHAVAIIPTPERREVWRTYSSGFEDWLRAAYWHAKEAGVAETTMKAALATLSAAGINDGDEIEVHVRAARCHDGYVLDLCDEQWRAIHITAQGWRVVDVSPVLFTRTPSMRPLPAPERGADIGLLWQHTNIPPQQRLTVLCWLLDCFRPDTPFPVLELVGEQGSAKSTTQAVLRSLVDPNKVMLRGRPKTVEDVFVAAANNWLVSYENLSGLTPEQQDAFCTLSTGGGFAARQLYTNGEEHIMETKRPVVLNGIAVVATRPDLIDRVIHVDLPTIPADARRDDADTHAGWERDQPKVFAGLLDLFSAALATLPTVKLTQKQRMADYERLGEAVARALGFAAGEFQQQYAELVRAGIDRALESNAVAQALDKYIAERVLPLNWQGTAGQLYDLLNTHSIPDRSSWPRSPKGLSDQLRRIAPAYRAKGIDITHLGHSREGARWRIAQTRSQTNPATPPGIEGGTRYGAHRE